MKRIFIIALTAALSLLLIACGAAEGEPPPPEAADSPASARQHEQGAAPDTPVTPEEAASELPAADGTAITLTVNGQAFSAALLENESARQLAQLLPLTLDMSELNGNEKYFYLDNGLPADSHQPGQINAGDLMLYGDNCLVLFYETFSSGYSYTRLGRVDDPAGLAEVLGTGSVTVSFSAAD